MQSIEQIISAEWLDLWQSRFLGASAIVVAPELIGCTLIRQLPDGRQLRGRIVETEVNLF